MSCIYADYAATTPLMPEVFEAMLPWLTENYGNASSLYKYGRVARKAVENARRSVAAALGARYDEIFFTGGGTESNVSAIRGVLEAGRAAKLVSSTIEHHSVLHTVQTLASRGTPLTLISPDETGVIDPDALEAAVTQDALVSIHFANNEIGTIEPIADLARTVHARGGLLHCDCVQAGGHLPLELDSLGVDLASFSAHKFGGPKGVGIIYVRNRTPFAPLLTGGAQEWNMRAGTENVAGIIGLAKALEISCGEMESEAARLRTLRDRFTTLIADIPRMHCNSRAKNRLPGLINLSFEFLNGENIAVVMDQKGVSVSPGSACAAGSHEPSHVLLGIGVERDLANAAVRISLGRGTTDTDIDDISTALHESVKFLRFLQPMWREMEENGQI